MPIPICFDIDDTLVIGTGYRFRRAVLESCLIILDAFAPEPVSPTKLLQLQHEYDVELMPTYGYARARFCRSLTETYRHIAKSRGRPVQRQVLRRLYRTAGQAFRPPYVVAPQAYAVLDELQARGHPLSAVTIGTPRIQARKLSLTKLDRYFGRAVFFARDADEKQAVIARCLLGLHCRPGVMVGDSLHHDIRTALAAGVTAVWVRTPDLWQLFEAELDPSLYHTIDDLAELLPIVEALEKG